MEDRDFNLKMNRADDNEKFNMLRRELKPLLTKYSVNARLPGDVLTVLVEVMEEKVQALDHECVAREYQFACTADANLIRSVANSLQTTWGW